MGFLTGKIDVNTTFSDNDFRGQIPRFASEAREANQTLVALIRSVGERTGATPAQVALAWLLAQTPWIVPLSGTRSSERLRENIGALSATLSRDDLQQLTAGSAPSRSKARAIPKRCCDASDCNERRRPRKNNIHDHAPAVGLAD